MRTDGKTTKQKATSLTLNKLSVVSKPAHAGALAAIIKSAAMDEEELNKETFAESLNQILIEEEAQVLMSTTWDLMYALRKSVRKTIEDSQIINKKEVIQSNITDFATALSGIIAATSIIKQEGTKMSKELTQEKVDQMIKEAVQPYKDKLGIAENVAKMDAVSKGHYDTLDDAGKADFLKLSAEAQKDTAELAVKKAADNDEIFEADGNVIRKSEVGANVFQMLKNSHEKATNAEKVAKEERDERELQTFTKTAEDLYANLPGAPADKGSVLKAIAGMPEKIGTTLTAMLKAGNEGVNDGKLFTEIGKGGTPVATDAEAELNKMAEEKAKELETTFAKAYDEVLKTPRGEELYNKISSGK